MPFQQNIERARAETIGTHGVRAAAFEDALRRSGAALESLRNAHVEETLPLLRLPARTDDLADIERIAGRLRTGATDVVVLGTGGSSLGGQTIAQLADVGVRGAEAFRAPPRMHFMDNLDPGTYGTLLGKLPLATTRFIAISKSGGTGETLMQTAAALAAVKRAGLDARTGELFFGISESANPGKSNGLRDLLGSSVAVLEHDPRIGGRYSGLSNVGLLPAAILGLDIKALRAGAAMTLAPLLAGDPAATVAPAVGAALNIAAAEAGKNIAVLMAYADRLERFSRWFVQLWAESLGKDGKGTTPLGALGPVDQHSQLQLFIAGPRDKLFTVITVATEGQGPRIDGALAERAGEPDFSGHTIGDLVAAQGRATAETLAKNGCPVRTIHLPRLDETSLGALMMHFFLETMIAAHLLGVDAFDQPAVEEGKVLAKRYLADG
ncbi:MAG: glucose-6-phosphate isomerase [Alphaproteobacteria bacterium]|nr:MAG: glucose-6-phosphate isomerase [Alphaproteobacteria bacterium]